MHRYFNVKVMMAEAGRIRTIFLVFTLTYCSRAVVFLLGMYDVIEDFLNYAIIYLVCYNIWDVLPLTLIMIYHSRCYDAQQRQREEEEAAAAAEAEAAENESSSSSSSSSSQSSNSSEETTGRPSLRDTVYEQRMSDISAREEEQAREEAEAEQV